MCVAQPTRFLPSCIPSSGSFCWNPELDMSPDWGPVPEVPTGSRPGHGAFQSGRALTERGENIKTGVGSGLGCVPLRGPPQAGSGGQTAVSAADNAIDSTVRLVRD